MYLVGSHFGQCFRKESNQMVANICINTNTPQKPNTHNPQMSLTGNWFQSIKCCDYLLGSDSHLNPNARPSVEAISNNLLKGLKRVEDTSVNWLIEAF